MIIGMDFQSLIAWFFDHGLKILAVLFLSYLISSFLKVFIEKTIKNKIVSKINGGKNKRAETLISIFGGSSKFIVYITAFLMILPEFGINVAPILASVGILGLAIGMAARDIISDFISGLFIILEDQYDVGDKVKIAGVEGEVKKITLRRTIIIEEDGACHSVPNSQIKLVTKKLAREMK